MKQILTIAVLALLLSTTACNNNSKDRNVNVAEIEMVSPVQVYEAVYGEDSLQLVDVRTAEEYDVNHLKNAQNICVTSPDFKAKVEALDRNKPVYVYCKKGGRSAKAAAILKDMGFHKVYDLQGGITSWQQNGLETVK